MAEAITAENIISNAQCWTFEGDCSLLQWMKQIAENLEERVSHTAKELNTLNVNVKRTSIALDNAANSLNTLASLQFVENRVHDDDASVLKPTVAAVEKQTEEPKTSAEVLQQFLKNNLKMLESCHDKYVVDFEDSDEEDNANNCIYQPKNPYNERLLPHIYGTKLWKENWHVGLCDTSNDYSGDEVSETYSESSKSAAEDNESFESNTEENLSEWASSTSNLNDSKYPTHIAVQNASSLRGSQPLFPESTTGIQTRTLSSSAETNSSLPATGGSLNTNKTRTYEHDLFATIQHTPPTLSSASSTKSSNEERNSSSAALKPETGASAYEVNEPRLVRSPVTQVKRKPVNLFDDDDFNSFMTEIVDKAQKKSDASPPPVPAERKLAAKPKEREPTTESRKPIEDQPIQTISTRTMEAHETSTKASKPAATSKTPVDLFAETPKEKPTAPINIVSKSVADRPTLNLFDSPPDDDLFYASTRKTGVYAAESAAVSKTRITAQSLFDDDDEDDDFLNVFGTKKLTLPKTYQRDVALFDDDEDDTKDVVFPKTDQVLAAVFPDKENVVALPKTTRTIPALFDDHKMTSNSIYSKTGLFDDDENSALPIANQTKAALFDDKNNDEKEGERTERQKPKEDQKSFSFASEKTRNLFSDDTDISSKSKSEQTFPNTSNVIEAAKRTGSERVIDDSQSHFSSGINLPKSLEVKISDEPATEEPKSVSVSSDNELSVNISSELFEPAAKERFAELPKQPLTPAPKEPLSLGNESFKTNVAAKPNPAKLVLSDLFADDIEADDDLFSKNPPSKHLGVEKTVIAAAEMAKDQLANKSSEDLGVEKYQSIAEAENEASAGLVNSVGEEQFQHIADNPPPSTEHTMTNKFDQEKFSTEATQSDDIKFDFSIQENAPPDPELTPKETAPNSQHYSGLFLDEPPDDDGFFQSLSSKHLSSSKLTLNLDQDFEEPNLPEVPFTSKEVEATDNTNYGGLRLFSEVPPDDDFDLSGGFIGSTIKTPGNSIEPLTKGSPRVFYDDFNETLEAVNQAQAATSRPLHDIFSDEPPSDDEIFSINKTSAVKTAQSEDVTDKALNATWPKEVKKAEIPKGTGAVSKLQMPKININVQALLPNASAKLSFKNVASEEEKISPIADVATPVSTVIPALLQDTPKTPLLQEKAKSPTTPSKVLSSACKSRVRGPPNRKPSTRQGRQENYRKSVLDAERDDLLTQSVEEYLKDRRVSEARAKLIAEAREKKVDAKLFENAYGLPAVGIDSSTVSKNMKKSAEADLFADAAHFLSPTTPKKIIDEASDNKGLEQKTKSVGLPENKASKFDLSDLFSNDDQDNENFLFNNSVSQSLKPKDELQKENTRGKAISTPSTELSKSIPSEQSAEDQPPIFAAVQVSENKAASHDLVHSIDQQSPILSDAMPKPRDETSKVTMEVLQKVVLSKTATAKDEQEIFNNATTDKLKSKESQEPTKMSLGGLFADDGDEEIDDFLFKPKAVKSETENPFETENNAKSKDLSLGTKLIEPTPLTVQSENKHLKASDVERPYAAADDTKNKPPGILQSNTQPQLKTDEQPQPAVMAVKSKTQLFVDSFSDEDDLFGTGPPILKNAYYSTEAIKTATTKVIPTTRHAEVASESQTAKSKSSESKRSQPKASKTAKASLFGDEQSDTDEDELFPANKNPPRAAPAKQKSNKQNTRPLQKSLFGSENESDGDDFSKTLEHQHKPTQKIVKSLPTNAIKGEQPQQQAAANTKKQTVKSLFSDIESEDDDDLFGGGAAKTGRSKKTIKATTKTSSIAKTVLTGPQQPSTAKSKSTTSTSTVADNPLADLLNN